MTRDICMLAQEGLSVAALGLAGWFWWEWRKAASESRRLSDWGKWAAAQMLFHQARAMEAEGELLIGRLKRYRAVAQGNRTRAANKRAARDAKTAQLRGHLNG